jgi:pantothenate kinase
MSVSAATLANQIADHILAKDTWTGRRLISVAGPPAAGKSTVALALLDVLRDRGVAAALLAMDGFHMSNQMLDARGLRHRKGAPETFDLAGFVALLNRVRTGAEVLVPIFDRELDAAICAADVISSDDNLLIVEGNYLLLDDPDWRCLNGFWDLSVFLMLEPDILEHRLLQRWRRLGFSDAEAARKANDNDLPNARLVLENRLACDLELKSG